MKKAVIFTLLSLLAITVISYFLLPMLGVLIPFAAGVWLVLILSIFAFCFILFGLFFAAGLGAIILSLLMGVWTVIAIVLFPILFPILLPLLLVIGVIAYLRREKKIIVSKDEK